MRYFVKIVDVVRVDQVRVDQVGCSRCLMEVGGYKINLLLH